MSYPVGGKTKRAFDIAASLFFLCVASPIFLLVALAMYLFDLGPIFYAQRRIGFAGREFSCWKFRTMIPGAEALLESILQDPETRWEWEAGQKLKNDPRVTSVGRFLRKTNFDELPQLGNVLWGDMSLVGPRPIVQDEVKHYGVLWDFYLKARPGLTGLWQISGRSDTSYEDRVVKDTVYVIRWSFWTDVWIVVKTVYCVLLQKGSY